MHTFPSQQSGFTEKPHRLCFFSGPNAHRNDRNEVSEALEQAQGGKLRKDPSQLYESSTQALQRTMLNAHRNVFDFLPIKTVKGLVGAALSPVKYGFKVIDKVPLVGTLVAMAGHGGTKLIEKMGVDKFGKGWTHEGKLRDLIDDASMQKLEQADASFRKSWKTLWNNRRRTRVRLAFNNARKEVIQDLRGLMQNEMARMTAENAKTTSLLNHLKMNKIISAAELNDKAYYAKHFLKNLDSIEKKIIAENKADEDVKEKKKWESSNRIRTVVLNELRESGAPSEAIDAALDILQKDKGSAIKALIDQYVSEPRKKVLRTSIRNMVKNLGPQIPSDRYDNLAIPEKLKSVSDDPPTKNVTFVLGGKMFIGHFSTETSSGVLLFKMNGGQNISEYMGVHKKTGLVMFRKATGEEDTYELGKKYDNDFFRNPPSVTRR